ncbi:RNA polymerase sigma factor [Saccharothrix stipae]
MSDESLLQRLKVGDPAASAELFELCRVLLPDFFYRRLPRDEEVDDCVSEVATRALEGFRKGAEPHSLRSWVRGIAVNLVREKYAAWRQRSASGVPDDLVYRPGEPYLEIAQSKIDVEDLLALPSDVEVIATKRDLWALLYPAIESIDPALKPVMREHVRLSLDRDTLIAGPELALALDVPVRTLSRQLERARKATRGAIVALVLARTGRASCGALAGLLDRVFTPDQGGAGSGLILTSAQCQAILRHAAGCAICAPRAVDAGDYNKGTAVPSSGAGDTPVALEGRSSARRRVVAGDRGSVSSGSVVAASEGVPEAEEELVVYTSGDDGSRVRDAVVDLLEAAGYSITAWQRPERGSWFQRLSVRPKGSAAAKTLASTLAAVSTNQATAESLGAVVQGAHITSVEVHSGPVAAQEERMANVVARLLEACRGHDDVVVYMRPILLIKLGPSITVREPTDDEHRLIADNPHLLHTPRDLLARLIADESRRKDGRDSSCDDHERSPG